MNILDSRYYAPCRVLLSLIGQWPLQDRKTSLLRKIAVFFVLVTAIVGQVCKILTSDRDLDTILAILPTMIINVDTLMICCSYHFRSDHIKKMLKIIENDWEKWSNDRDVSVMHKHAGDATTFANFYTTYVYVCITIVVTIPLIPEALDIIKPLNESRHRLHPFKGEYFVDEQEYFHLILLHMAICGYVILTAITASDVMFIIYAQHACGKFAILRNNIQRALSATDKESPIEEKTDFKNDATHRSVIVWVEHHRQTAAFVSMIEHFYSWPLFIQIALNIVCMTFTLAKVALWLGDETEMVMTITWIFGQLVHMLIISYPGQLLLDHSQCLFNDVYNSEWYNVPIASQKLLLLIMQRCLEPSHLTVGKLFVLCLENYVTIIQSSVSYCMALSSLQRSPSLDE